MFMPPSMPGDSERNRWGDISKDLQGRVAKSVDELKSLFLEDDDFGEIRLIEKDNLGWRENYTQYGRVNKRYFNSLEPVAYECPSCDKIVIGPTEVIDDTSINDGHPLSGRLGYDVYCTNCGGSLDRHTIMVS